MWKLWKSQKSYRKLNKIHCGKLVENLWKTFEIKIYSSNDKIITSAFDTGEPQKAAEKKAASE